MLSLSIIIYFSYYKYIFYLFPPKLNVSFSLQFCIIAKEHIIKHLELQCVTEIVRKSSAGLRRTPEQVTLDSFIIFFLVFNSNSPQSYKKRKKRTSKSCSHYSQKLQSSKYHHITNVKFVNNDVKEIGNQTTVTLRPQLNELVVVTRRFSVAKSVV